MTQRIAFVGGGNMATSLVGGLRARGVPADAIVVADPDPVQRVRLQRDYGVATVQDGAVAAKAADVIVLAIKPQEMAAAARALAPVVAQTRPLIISVAAGIRLEDLARWLGPEATVVRTMPNRPALIGAGVTALCAGSNVGAASRRTAERILAACGATVWVEESLMDVVTAVSGTGPAYFFLLVEALEDAAVVLGMDRGTARLLAIETARGAGRMAAESTESAAELRAQVTSQGGTTVAAFEILDSADVRAIFARAVAAAARRSAELAQDFGTA